MQKTSPSSMHGLESMITEQEQDMTILPKIGVALDESVKVSRKEQVMPDTAMTEAMHYEGKKIPVWTAERPAPSSMSVKEEIDIDAHIAQLKGVWHYTVRRTVPLFSLAWTPKHIAVAAGLAILVNLLLLSALSGNSAESTSDNMPQVRFEPSDMSAFLSQPLPSDASQANDIAPFTVMEHTGSEEAIEGIPNRHVVTISPQDRQQLIQKLNFSSEELSPRHNSDIEKYDTYVNPKP